MAQAGDKPPAHPLRPQYGIFWESHRSWRSGFQQALGSLTLQQENPVKSGTGFAVAPGFGFPGQGLHWIKGEGGWDVGVTAAVAMWGHQGWRQQQVSSAWLRASHSGLQNSEKCPVVSDTIPFEVRNGSKTMQVPPAPRNPGPGAKCAAMSWSHLCCKRCDVEQIPLCSVIPPATPGLWLCLGLTCFFY